MFLLHTHIHVYTYVHTPTYVQIYIDILTRLPRFMFQGAPGPRGSPGNDGSPGIPVSPVDTSVCCLLHNTGLSLRDGSALTLNFFEIRCNNSQLSSECVATQLATLRRPLSAHCACTHAMFQP